MKSAAEADRENRRVLLQREVPTVSEREKPGEGPRIAGTWSGPACYEYLEHIVSRSYLRQRERWWECEMQK